MPQNYIVMGYAEGKMGSGLEVHFITSGEDPLRLLGYYADVMKGRLYSATIQGASFVSIPETMAFYLSPQAVSDGTGVPMEEGMMSYSSELFKRTKIC